MPSFIFKIMNNSIKNIFIFIGIFIFISVNLYSQTFVAPEIIVKEKKIPEKEEKLPYTKTVIKIEKFKFEEKTLGEFLKNTPGIHITNLSGRGSYTITSIRGSTSSQVLIYIDGILVNSGGQSAVDLSTIPIEEIDKIEIYRGNVPAKFGRGGIGGVINIITKKNIKKSFSTYLSYGSWKFYKFENELKYNSKFGKNFLNISFEGRTGDFPYYNDANTPFNPDDDYHAKRKNNYYNQKNILYNFSQSWEKFAFGLTFRNFFKHRNLPGAAPGSDLPNAHPVAYLTTANNHIDTSFSFFILKGFINAQFFTEKENKKFYNRKPEFGPGLYGLEKSKYITYKSGINLSYELELNDFINLKIYNQNSFERLKVDFTPNSNAVKDGRYKRKEFDISFENDFYLFNKKFIVSPVYRINKIIDKSKKSKDNFRKNSWSIGLKYYPFSKNLYLKLNYGKFKRYPNFYEKFGDGGGIIQSIDLKPEYSKNLDYGFGYDIYSKKYNIHFNFEWTYFYNKINDLIEYVIINERFSKYLNIEDVKIKGYELSSSLNLGLINFNINYTKLDSKSLQKGYKKNKPLPNRPGHTFYGRIQLNLSKLIYWLEFNEIGKNFFDNGGNFYYNTYDTLNSGITWTLTKNLKLNITIKNLTNEQDMYAYAVGHDNPKTPYYPLEGRSFYISMNYRF